MKNHYKTEFDRLDFNNRWKRGKHSRPGDWVVLGFGKWYAGWASFKYYFSFFGLEVSAWFIKVHQPEDKY